MDGEAPAQMDQDAPGITSLREEHRRYSQQLESLLSKPYLSEEERLEEVRLKKLKLHLKDRIFGVRTA